MIEKNFVDVEKEGFDKWFKFIIFFGIGNMVCFDLNGKIKKYVSFEEILEEFFYKCFEFYGYRKVCYFIY